MSAVSDESEAGPAPAGGPLEYDLRVEARGEVDELNACVALALAALPARSRFRPWLGRIQNDLLDVGADLAAPLQPDDRPRLRVAREQVEWVERACEQADREPAPLRPLALVGTSEASARLRLASAVCRRAERRGVALSRREPVNLHLLAYLDRLGDLLLVLARAVDVDSGERPRARCAGAAALARAAERILPEPLPPSPAGA